MSTRKQGKRIQPLLYIDTPEQHETDSQEVDILYKRDHLVREENLPADDHGGEGHEHAEENRRSFNLAKHLGYDWPESNTSQNDAHRMREQQASLSEPSADISKREPIDAHLGTSGESQENEEKDEERPQTFDGKSVKEKTAFLLKMRQRTPMTCICKTNDKTWVGTVTAADEQSFTMQTQQPPYFVTVNYDDVRELSLDHFS